MFIFLSFPLLCVTALFFYDGGGRAGVPPEGRFCSFLSENGRKFKHFAQIIPGMFFQLGSRAGKMPELRYFLLFVPYVAVEHLAGAVLYFSQTYP